MDRTYQPPYSIYGCPNLKCRGILYFYGNSWEQSPQDTDADQIPSAAATGVNTGTDHSRHTPERDAHSAVTTRTIAFQSTEWRLQDDA